MVLYLIPCKNSKWHGKLKGWLGRPYLGGRSEIGFESMSGGM